MSTDQERQRAQAAIAQAAMEKVGKESAATFVSLGSDHAFVQFLFGARLCA